MVTQYICHSIVTFTQIFIAILGTIATGSMKLMVLSLRLMMFWYDKVVQCLQEIIIWVKLSFNNQLKFKIFGKYVMWRLIIKFV